MATRKQTVSIRRKYEKTVRYDKHDPGCPCYAWGPEMETATQRCRCSPTTGYCNTLE